MVGVGGPGLIELVVYRYRVGVEIMNGFGSANGSGTCCGKLVGA